MSSHCARVLVLSAVVFSFVGCQDTGETAESGDSCSACRIVIEPVLELGSEDGWDAFSQWSSFGFFGDRVLLSDLITYPGQVVLFDVDSIEARQVIGRSGEGPGEIQRVAAMWLHSDGVHVFDSRLSRETVFTEAGELVASYQYDLGGPMSRTGSRVILPEGRLVVNATVHSRESVGYPLHLLDKNRVLVRSFGADTAMLVPGLVDLNHRALGRASGGHLWVGRVNEYRLEKWAIEGQHLETYEWEHPWFEPWLSIETTDYSVAPPPPTFWAVQEDSANDLLWLYFSLPDANYKPSNPDDGLEHRVDIPGLSDIFDSGVDIRELPSMRLVHRQRFDDHFSLAGPQIVRTTEMTEQGVIRLKASRLRLHGLARQGTGRSLPGAPPPQLAIPDTIRR